MEMYATYPFLPRCSRLIYMDTSFTYIYLAVGIYNGPRNIIRIGVCATVRIQTYTQTIITYTHTSIYPCNSMHISYNSMRISLYKL